MRRRLAGPGLVVLALLGVGRPAAADGPRPEPAVRSGEDLALADLAPYRAALEGRPGGTPTPVTFRTLWDHPEPYQGRRVRVEGRVMRRFRQGAVGTFPPLVEAWAVTPAGDPFCLVFPDTGESAGPASAPGTTVRFDGVYLRQIRYRGGDTARLAPLIVGDRVPDVVQAAPVAAPGAGGPTGGGLSTAEWTLGLVVTGIAALALARSHLGRAARPPRRERESGPEPPPEFVEPA